MEGRQTAAVYSTARQTAALPTQPPSSSPSSTTQHDTSRAQTPVAGAQCPEQLGGAGPRAPHRRGAHACWSPCPLQRCLAQQRTGACGTARCALLLCCSPKHWSWNPEPFPLSMSCGACLGACLVVEQSRDLKRDRAGWFSRGCAVTACCSFVGASTACFNVLLVRVLPCLPKVGAGQTSTAQCTPS